MCYYKIIVSSKEYSNLNLRIENYNTNYKNLTLNYEYKTAITTKNNLDCYYFNKLSNNQFNDEDEEYILDLFVFDYDLSLYITKDKELILKERSFSADFNKIILYKQENIINEHMKKIKLMNGSFICLKRNDSSKSSSKDNIISYFLSVKSLKDIEKYKKFEALPNSKIELLNKNLFFNFRFIT